MSSCALEGCSDPSCPVCRFAGRDVVEIQRELQQAWRKARDIELPLAPLKEPEKKKGKR